MLNKVELPILDCSEIVGSLEEIQDSESFKNFSMKLGNGMRDFGFVYLINHDTEAKTIDNFYSKFREFFALPNEIKWKYRKQDAVENFNGFTRTTDESLGELAKVNDSSNAPSDMKECYDFWGQDAFDESKYPTEIPGLKEVQDRFRSSFTNLTKKLLRCFGIYLNLEDKDYLINKHKALEDPSIFSHNVTRSNYYYPIKNEREDQDGIIRLGEHCDWGTFTYLFQDEIGGLEAKMSDGQWIPVKPIKNSIVFNAGLMLEIWSGGLIPAAFHRVRAIGKNQSNGYRQSSAFFLQPDGTSTCTPLVPVKSGWIPDIPFNEAETHYDFFRHRVRNSRNY